MESSSPGSDGTSAIAELRVGDVVDLPKAPRLPRLASVPELEEDEPKKKRSDLPKIDAKLAAKAGVVVVGILAVVGNWAVKRATKSQGILRKPSTEESTAIATPIAAILSRHIIKGEKLDDLFDVASAIMAADDYMSAGPLIIPASGSITFNDEVR